MPQKTNARANQDNLAKLASQTLDAIRARQDEILRKIDAAEAAGRIPKEKAADLRRMVL